MIRLATALLGLTVFTGAVLWGLSITPGGSDAHATLVLGFAILSAHLFGLLLRPIGLPLVTGYLLLGLIAGPHAMGLITREATADLRLISDIALCLIALTAGGELVLGQLRPLLRGIAAITLSQVTLVFAGMITLVWLMAGHLPFAVGLGQRETLAIALLVGLMAVATSPATTIAVITETRAGGRLTETILGVTILKDVVVILLFAIVFAVADVLVRPETEMALRDLGTIALNLALSVGAGVGLGASLAPLLPRVGRQLPALVAGTAIGVAAAARPLGLDPLILCIAAGFTVRNLTSRGRELIRGIESVSPMIYAVFFTITGAALNVAALRTMWAVALVLVFSRAMLMVGSTWVSSRVIEDQPTVRRWAGLGLLGQGGVTLGLAALVANQFTGWGADLRTLIVAAVAVNEIAGPVLLKIALVHSGEVGRREIVGPQSSPGAITSAGSPPPAEVSGGPVSVQSSD
ncbi:cation:proton antiporter [Candidatus Sumerlaeota bacterium]|nr:cation:proton antiporter [Candidatus Sumerlaeota bacterium]